MAFEEKWLLLLFMFEVIYADTGLRCRLTSSSDECKIYGSTSDEHFFNLKGDINLQVNYGPTFFHLTCPNNVPLESTFLPVFEQEVIFNRVKLSKCHPPANGYAEALLSLNITVRFTLELDSISEGFALQPKHFESLNITALAISAVPGAFLLSEPGFIEPLTRLVDLRLTKVYVDAQTILRLPPNLKQLHLKGTGIERLPAAALARLTELKTLVLTEERLQDVDLSMARALRVVQLKAPVDGLTLSPNVTNVTLIGVRGSELRGDCAALQFISVQETAAPLPGHWLAHCPRVATALVVTNYNLSAADEWRGASALFDLSMSHCALRDLPADWLERVFKLQRLDLSYNDLEFLPGDLFKDNANLRWLNLRHNKLRRDATAALGPLLELRWLSLGENPLGDLCEVKGAYQVTTVSLLRPLRALETLQLDRTGASRVCQDWRMELRRLANLDLSHNNVTRLQFTDTQWRRAAESRVNLDLSGCTVTELEYSSDEYAAALAVRDPPGLLRLAAAWSLPCRCHEYWAARALAERPAHAPALADARCADGTRLLARDADSLVCDVPPAECPAGCKCAATPGHSELRCAGAGLRVLPRAAAPLPPAGVLLAARNRLTRIAPLDAIANLTLLDVSENNITTIDAVTTAALFGAPGRRVLLAGNPLDCGCGALPLMRALAEHPARVPDLARATCAGGGSLAHAAERAAVDCPGDGAPLWPAAAALALLLLPAVLLASALSRPAVRARIKVFLFERGLCLRWALRPMADDDADDATRPYDAFVSFSHRDAEYAHEVAARLESGPRALRLCLHERDWTPGEWIPAQIAASVRRSRRTLVLLSEHFLSSDWAQAELREAYAAALAEHRPRLLVVLLPGLAPARAAHSPELRAYLAAVTYLRWDDPRFWDKLRLALPPPRAELRAADEPAKSPPALAPPLAPHPTPTAA